MSGVLPSAEFAGEGPLGSGALVEKVRHGGGTSGTVCGLRPLPLVFVLCPLLPGGCGLSSMSLPRSSATIFLPWSQLTMDGNL